MNHSLILLFVLSFGFCCTMVGLAVLLYQKEKKIWQFKTILFLIYMVTFFLINGVHFYITNIVDYRNDIFDFVVQMAQNIAYSLLIYYLAATINYILGRKWSKSRLIKIVAVAFLYFCGGVIKQVTGSPIWLSAITAVLFMAAILWVLADGARSLTVLNNSAVKTSVIVICLIAVLFLPMIAFGSLLIEITFSVSFLLTSVFFMLISIAGITFFMQYILRPQVNPSEVTFNPDSCGKYSLTAREVDVALHISRGLTYKEIGEELSISPNTVSNHIASIYRKTDTGSKLEMVNKLR